jgi:hypothetical protein
MQPLDVTLFTLCVCKSQSQLLISLPILTAQRTQERQPNAIFYNFLQCEREGRKRH